MTNANEELSLQELDGISGGTGSLGDVATYVKAYVEALGVNSTPAIIPYSGPANPPGCPKPPAGQHG